MLRSVKSSAFALLAWATALVAPAAAQNWDASHQVRFGAFVMYADTDTALNANTGTAIIQESRSHGLWGGGVQAGLEWVRRGLWSAGVEMDIAATEGNASFSSTETSVDYLATLRARAGLFLRQDLLVYGTVGVGFIGAEVREVANRAAFTKRGLAAGGGIEYDHGPWILAAEYLNIAFDTWEGTIGTTQYSYDPSMHVFRLGLKFKVGHDHYHDDVRERLGRPMK
jgi:opacity protein-like surface antigen